MSRCSGSEPLFTIAGTDEPEIGPPRAVRGPLDGAGFLRTGRLIALLGGLRRTFNKPGKPLRMCVTFPIG